MPTIFAKVTADGLAMVLTADIVIFFVSTSAQDNVEGVIVTRLCPEIVSVILAIVPGMIVNPPVWSNGITTLDLGVITGV